jgi:drug/metabolite transporter (DMT)-like permease
MRQRSDIVRETDTSSHSTFDDKLVMNEKEKNLREEKRTFPRLIVWIPTLLDLFEHITRNISMTLIAASAASMLRSTVVIFAAILSVFYLKNKLYRHHAVSVILIILGTSIVGVALLIEGGKNN